VFRPFLDNKRTRPDAYPFNNQLGWATCFSFTSPTESLRSGADKKPLTLDDAEWFKGEDVKVNAGAFVLNAPGSTKLKACPGRSYHDTDWTVEAGDTVHRLLRKREDDETNWLFVCTLRGFGWLQEQPMTAAAKAPDEPAQH
jgi:hypothetical protein